MIPGKSRNAMVAARGNLHYLQQHRRRERERKIERERKRSPATHARSTEENREGRVPELPLMPWIYNKARWEQKGRKPRAPSSKAVGIPPLRYQSHGENAGALTYRGSIHSSTPQRLLSVRVHRGYLPGTPVPGLQQGRLVILPHRYLKCS